MAGMFLFGLSKLLGAIGEGIGGTVTDLIKTADTYSAAGSTDPQALSDYHDRLVFDLALKNRKMNPVSKKVKILGVKNVVLKEISNKFIDGSANVSNALRDDANTVLDTTTYPDKALLKLYNGRGFDVYLRSMTLEGNRVMQYSGENGELIHDSLKRDDDIRRNGESTFEVGNEYIVTADQCARIADYWYKFLGKKKHLYSLSIPGCAAWYNVGDWYNLQVGEADTNEYIDAVVECYSVDVERVAGTIGSTTLLLRDVEDNWAKTTLYETRLATGGSPKRRVNRSNIVTVASSEYDGTYDWRCDGTDDDVQIQAAIDYVYNTFGGGTVQLTNGVFLPTLSITMRDNVTLQGAGHSTIIRRTSLTGNVVINMQSKTNCLVSALTISGTGYTYTNVDWYIVLGNLSKNCVVSNVRIDDFTVVGSQNILVRMNCVYEIDVVQNVSISNISVTNTSVATSFAASSVYGFNGCDRMTQCTVEDIESVSSSTNGSASASAFLGCTDVSLCKAITMKASSGGGNLYKQGYSVCRRLTNNTVQNAEANAIGFSECTQCQQNDVISSTTPYYLSYSDAAGTQACADDANGGFNS